MSINAAASETVAQNLAEADHAQGLDPHANVTTTFEETHAAPHVEPKALGLDATAWVALAMIVVIALMLWKKVPAAIGGALDKKIAGIRVQLDEAQKLRAEAEALRSEYQAKAAAAEQDAASIRAQAEAEAEAIRAKARTDADALVERRARMAEDKIGAAERAAVAAVRTKAAQAATAAAATLLGEVHTAEADKALVDRTINRLN